MGANLKIRVLFLMPGLRKSNLTHLELNPYHTNWRRIRTSPNNISYTNTLQMSSALPRAYKLHPQSKKKPCWGMALNAAKMKTASLQYY